MSRLYFLVVSLIGLMVPVTGMALDVLVEPKELAKLLAKNEVKILDIRAQQAAGIEGYENGHLPGAVNAPYANWRGTSENPGELKTDEEFSALVGAAGLTPTDKVVIANVGNDSSDFGAAARVYWTLKSLGFSQLSILDGGMFAWRQSGLPLDKSEVIVTPVELSLTFNDRWLATEEDVYDIVEGNEPGLLLDARPEEFFIGRMKHREAIEYGTIEGAKLLNNLSLFPSPRAEIGSARGQIVDIINSVTEKNSSEAPLVSFCNTGHWAATNWFFASELAGQENATLFAESIVGWTAMGNEAVIGELD